MSEIPDGKDIHNERVPSANIGTAPAAPQITTSLPSISSILSNNSDRQGFIPFPPQTGKPPAEYNHTNAFPYPQEEGYYQPAHPGWQNFPPNPNLPMNHIYPSPYPHYIQRTSGENLGLSSDMYRVDQKSGNPPAVSTSVPSQSQPIHMAPTSSMGSNTDIENLTPKLIVSPVNESFSGTNYKHTRKTSVPGMNTISNSLNNIRNSFSSLNSLHGNQSSDANTRNNSNSNNNNEAITAKFIEKNLFTATGPADKVNESLNSRHVPLQFLNSTDGSHDNFSLRGGKSVEEAFSGPPKTSRFFKSVSPEVNRHPEIPGFGFVGSSHHYNPYLYPQNKSKQYQGCDFVGVLTGENYKSLFVTSYAIKNKETIPLSGGLSQIPVVKPTLEEFQNPIQYIESLKALGEKYGAIKVIPPVSWDTKSSLNSELVWFKSRRQLWNGYENEMRARLEFHTNLNKFLATEGKNSYKLYKLPSIDRRTLDLFRFRAVVNIRGGFEDVCNKKLWAQIGREMGYSGRITSSLSSSLKSHYQRILYKFDKYMEELEKNKNVEENNSSNGSQVSDSASTQGSGFIDYAGVLLKKRKFEEECIKQFSVSEPSNKKAKVESSEEKNENEVKTETGVKTEHTDGNENCDVKEEVKEESGSSRELTTAADDKDDKDTDTEKQKVNVPLIIASSTQIFRPRTNLYKKGIRTYFDTVTDHRPGITVDDDQTLPSYDFYKWHDKSDTIDDASPHDNKVSPLYNLKQFYEKSLKMESLFLKDYPQPGESIQSSFLTFEKLFWRMLQSPEVRLETEASVQLPTTVHESGFPVPDRYESESSKQARTVLDLWNLNNLPIADSSVFQYLRGDHESLLHPHLTCNMFFSSQSWNMEDHFLYNVDYNHLGAKKLWYFIPESSREKYEKLLEKYIELNNSQESTIPNMLDEVKDSFADSGDYVTAIYDNQPFSTSKKPRARHLNPKFNKFISEEPYNSYHSDIFLPPSVLKENGIEVYGTYQSEREFIVRYPKVYSSNVSFGFNVSESVPLAPPSWLEVADEGISWLSKQQIPSRFSVLRILLDIISSCNDNAIVQTAKPVFKKLFTEEMEKRQAIRKITEVKEINKSTSVDSRDPVTDADLIDTFPSCICLKDIEDPLSTFTMSPKYFLENEVYINSDKFLFEFHVYVSDDSLRHADKLISSNTVTADEWYQKYKGAIEGYDKPSLKVMNNLYSEGEPAFKYVSDVERLSPDFQKALVSFQNLGKYIEETEEWNKKAKVFLDSRLQTKLRGNKRRSTKDTESEEKEKEKERKKQEEKHLWKSADELNELINQIYDLPLSVPEMDQLIEFAKAVEDYEISARNLLSNGVSNSSQGDDEIESLIVLGESFSLKLDSLVLLERILKRRRWLKKASQLDSISDTAELKALIDEGEFVCSGSDHYKMLSLIELYDRVIKVNSEMKELISPPNEIVSIELLNSAYQKFKNLPIDQEIKSKYFDLTQTHSKLKDFLERTAKIPISIEEEISSAADDFKQQLDLSLKRFKRLFFDDFIADVLNDASKFTDMPAQFLKHSFEEFREWYKEFTADFGLVMVEPVEGEARAATVKSNKQKLKALKDKCAPCMAITQDKKSDFFVEGQSFNERRYCFCRMPENGYMIECDQCSEWFHFNCVGYDESMEEFTCAICDNGKGSLATTSKHLKEMETRITFEKLKQLYQKSQKFFIFAEEFEQFIELLKMSCEFTSKLREVLAWDDGKCIETDLNKVTFYLRKVEGCGIIFENERESLRTQFEQLVSAKKQHEAAIKEENLRKEKEEEELKKEKDQMQKIKDEERFSEVVDHVSDLTDNKNDQQKSSDHVVKDETSFNQSPLTESETVIEAPVDASTQTENVQDKTSEEVLPVEVKVEPSTVPSILDEKAPDVTEGEFITAETNDTTVDGQAKVPSVTVSSSTAETETKTEKSEAVSKSDPILETDEKRNDL